jgi:MFS family permease
MRLWRFCLAALVYDWVVFIAWVAIPIRAESLRVTPTQLGLLITAHSVLYVGNSLFVGRLADRMSKPFLAFLGCAGAIASFAAIARADSLLLLFLTVPLLAVAASCFWPSVQGSVGTETDPARMERVLALFNVMWSGGKALGFVCGGWLAARFGETATLWIAAGTVIPILALYPWRKGTPAPAPREAPVGNRAGFRRVAYVANFVAFGVGAAFQNQFFKYLSNTGLGRSFEGRTLLGVPLSTALDAQKWYFGLFLGAIFFAQTAGFLLFQKGAWWTYRRAPLYLSQVALAAATLAVAFVRSDALILAMAPLVGLALSFAYASSIFYSLHGSDEHGKYSGIHEAVLGAGYFIVPLAGGWLADLMGDLRVPYTVAAATVLAAIGLEEVLYRRSVSSSSNRSIR